MKVEQLMTRDVETLRGNTSLLAAIRRMLGQGFSGMPVVDDAGRVVGIITEGDLLRRFELGTEKHRSTWMQFLTGVGRLTDEYIQSHGRRVEELMTPEPYVVAPDADLSDAVVLMQKHGIKRLPVVGGGRLVGMLSRADLLRGLSKQLADADAKPLDDAAIRTAILAEIGRQRWTPSESIEVSVTAGVVHFGGVVTSSSIPPALKVIAENVPGVKSVVDELTWIDPVAAGMPGL